MSMTPIAKRYNSRPKTGKRTNLFSNTRVGSPRANKDFEFSYVAEMERTMIHAKRDSNSTVRENTLLLTRVSKLEDIINEKEDLIQRLIGKMQSNDSIINEAS